MGKKIKPCEFLSISERENGRYYEVEAKVLLTKKAMDRLVKAKDAMNESGAAMKIGYRMDVEDAFATAYITGIEAMVRNGLFDDDAEE